jgi:uncharacterized protein (TIGR00730 family)
MQSICVYLAASLGASSSFAESVELLAYKLVERNLRLVYGGSSHGTMGVLADTVKQQGGTVIGVMPEHLIHAGKEAPSAVLDQLHVTSSMEARKNMMRDEADMFLVMPGGLGTLDEAVETWNEIRLGILDKPIGFFNPNGFFDGLFEFVQSCGHAGFISKEQTTIPKVHDNLEVLLDALQEAS